MVRGGGWRKEIVERAGGCGSRRNFLKKKNCFFFGYGYCRNGDAGDERNGVVSLDVYVEDKKGQRFHILSKYVQATAMRGEGKRQGLGLRGTRNKANN